MIKVDTIKGEGHVVDFRACVAQFEKLPLIYVHEKGHRSFNTWCVHVFCGIDLYDRTLHES